MLARTSLLAEKMGSCLAFARRGFLGWIGKRAVGAAAAVGAFWGSSGIARPGCPPPCSDNSDYNDDEYCQKAFGDCDGDGTCAPRPIFCLDEYIPVCGCDGVSYPNACYAAAFGVNVAHELGCGSGSL